LHSRKQKEAGWIWPHQRRVPVPSSSPASCADSSSPAVDRCVRQLATRRRFRQPSPASGIGGGDVELGNRQDAGAGAAAERDADQEEIAVAFAGRICEGGSNKASPRIFKMHRCRTKKLLTFIVLLSTGVLQ